MKKLIYVCGSALLAAGCATTNKDITSAANVAQTPYPYAPAMGILTIILMIAASISVLLIAYAIYYRFVVLPKRKNMAPQDCLKFSSDSHDESWDKFTQF